MIAGYQRRHQVGWIYGWQSTRGQGLSQGVDLTANHAGSAAPVDQGIHGFVKWRLMLESADEAWDTAVDRCQWRALRPQLVSHS